LNEDLKRCVTEVVDDGTSSVGVNVLACSDDNETEAVEEGGSAESLCSTGDVGEFGSEGFGDGENNSLSSSCRRYEQGQRYARQDRREKVRKRTDGTE